jgi:hypothetical protein
MWTGTPQFIVAPLGGFLVGMVQLTAAVFAEVKRAARFDIGSCALTDHRTLRRTSRLFGERDEVQLTAALYRGSEIWQVLGWAMCTGGPQDITARFGGFLVSMNERMNELPASGVFTLA